MCAAMHHRTRASVFLLSSFAVVACGGPPEGPKPPPVATTQPTDKGTAPPDAGRASRFPNNRRGDAKDKLHGVEVADPYRWLEDAKNDDVKRWMDEQDGRARAALAKLAGRDEIAARMKELFYVDSQGIPSKRGGRYFYSRRDAKQEKAVIYWREGKTGEEKVLLDPNSWSKDGNVSLGTWSVSWDGKKIAYAVKSNNSDESTLYVMDVATGKKSDVDVIEGAKYAHPNWTPKGDGFYYTWLPTDPKIPTADRPGFAEVRFHKLGEDPKKDKVEHERTGDAKTFLQPQLSKDGHFLLLYVQHGWSRTDVYVRDFRVPGKSDQGWKPLATGVDAEFDVEVYGDKFYVKTNEGAPHYRVFKVDPAKVRRDDWKEIVPERKDATLQGITIVGGKLSLGYLKDVVSQVELRDLDGKLIRELKLPVPGTASLLTGREDDDEAYYSFTSFTYPTEIYETSVKGGGDKLWFRLKLNVDASKYEVEQIFATSKDGTRVPAFVVHAKDFKKDGSAPLLLTGYGGFRAALSPGFRSSMFPWLERGGVYVIANLRGGNEYGEEWHRAGMGHNKQNVFDDFIGVAEHMVKEKYSSPGKMVIYGGSNGGLLVGAAMTQRPDLFRVVLCDVPLLDMVRYHLFGSGKTWIEEYGSADVADDFKAIYAYSPYHHVKAGTKYPSLLMLSADSDDRVDPMHARKFAAAIQDATTGGEVLLRIEKNAGHGGADLIKSYVEKFADMYAFALEEIKKPL
jgi:prolyl oligopeptidase